MKEIVLDTETTGLLVKDGHRIVEIGCIELDNLIPTKNKFHCYLNPERKVSEKALEVHGYTDEFLSSKKKFAEVAHGSSSDEYVNDYINRHNYFSQDTYSFMSNNPWSVMNEYKSHYYEDYSDTYSIPMKSINVEEIYLSPK